MDELIERLRGSGWSVAVHNDYRLKGVAHTFWLWTNDLGQYVKGEGLTDQEALTQCCKAAQTIADLTAENKRLNERYGQLIYSVSMKHPGESRHETALRYIRKAEQSSDDPSTASKENDNGCRANSRKNDRGAEGVSGLCSPA